MANDTELEKIKLSSEHISQKIENYNDENQDKINEITQNFQNACLCLSAKILEFKIEIDHFKGNITELNELKNEQKSETKEIKELLGDLTKNFKDSQIEMVELKNEQKSEISEVKLSLSQFKKNSSIQEFKLKEIILEIEKLEKSILEKYEIGCCSLSETIKSQFKETFLENEVIELPTKRITRSSKK